MKGEFSTPNRKSPHSFISVFHAYNFRILCVSASVTLSQFLFIVVQTWYVIYQALVDESFFFFVPIPFWYSHVEVLVKAVVTADVEPFLMEYTFGVHV